MSDARAYAQRNQRGSDWFTHDDKAAAPPAAAASPAHKPDSVPAPKTDAAAAEHDSGRTQMIKPKCDSNQWFKHEKAAEQAAPATAAASPAVAREAAESGKSQEVAAAGGAAETPKNQREGNAYGRRDKMGTSASWFHGEGDAAGGPTARIVSKEGGSNANRMRGESENWFNYDASSNKDAGKEVHVSKGRGNKPQNDEMRQIFNMGK